MKQSTGILTPCVNPSIDSHIGRAIHYRVSTPPRCCNSLTYNQVMHHVIADNRFRHHQPQSADQFFKKYITFTTPATTVWENAEDTISTLSSPQKKSQSAKSRLAATNQDAASKHQAPSTTSFDATQATELEKS